MSLSSPIWLATLLAVLLATLAYVASERAATRYAARFPALDTLRAAARAGGRWRTHVPSATTLLAFTTLAFALAGPQITTRVPTGRASIMLVTDHSGSMQATDVTPTRLAAANRAARTLIDELPPAVRVGVVTFSTEPDAIQGPTEDRRRVLEIIDAQQAVGATATGNALQVALSLLVHQKNRPPSAIVLLSDGAANAGRDPVEVGDRSRALRHPDRHGRPRAVGRARIPDPEEPAVQIPVPPDPQLMARIAAASKGQTFMAQDQSQLQDIYKHLGTRLGSRPQAGKHQDRVRGRDAPPVRARGRSLGALDGGPAVGDCCAASPTHPVVGRATASARPAHGCLIMGRHR